MDDEPNQPLLTKKRNRDDELTSENLPLLRKKRDVDDEPIYVDFSETCERSSPAPWEPNYVDFSEALRPPTKKIEFPPSMFPEFAQLPTDSLIEILEAMFASAPKRLKDLKFSKENYLRDKSNGFEFVSESYYIRVFELDSFAPFLLRDGKMDTSRANIFGCVPEEKFFGEDDYDYDSDDDNDYTDDDDDNDGNKDAVDEDDNKWLMILMGKQFLMKFMELENIEADGTLESVGRADWALFCCNGEMTDSLFFLNRVIDPFTT